MWIRHVFLGLAGLTAGAAVAGGTFAFLIMLNIIPPDDWKDEDCRPDLSLREYDCIRRNRRKPLISFPYDADSAGTYFSWSIWNLCRIIRRLCGSSIGGNFKDLPGYLPQNESKSGIVGDSLVYGIGKDSRLTFLFYKTVIRFLK